MSLEQHKLHLHFFDKSLESQFKQSREKHIRARLRLGIIMSVLFFSSGIPMIYFIIPEKFYHLSLILVAVLFPYFIFLLYTTFKKRFMGFYHFFAATSNVLSGLLIIYVLQFFPDGENYMLMILIFIVFFGLYMYRLGLILGIIVSLIYILSFQIYITFFVDLDPDHYLMLTYLAWLIEGFSIVAGYISEQNDRTYFIQKQTIRDQNIIIHQEKKKSENLLLNILPEHIAERLKNKKDTIADLHKNISVLFADIVGFTDLSTRVTAQELVKILNHVFSHFDRLTEAYGVEKIKTIGDAYMVAGGLQANDEQHTHRMVELSLEMMDYVKADEHLRKYNMEIRVGIHAGAIIAGVIGLNKFTYDLWGNTVNIASRLESNGEAGKVNISASVYQMIKEKYKCHYRGKISAKNVGDIDMYFIENEII